MTRILNLGCGTRTSPRTENIDWSIYQRLRRNPIVRALATHILTGVRLEQFMRMDDNLIVHDLRTGIPAEDQSVDAVYHSHVLEHIDRDGVASFFAEVRRVLRPGGVHRVVVPDLERYARAYLRSLEDGLGDPVARGDHDKVVSTMILQMVRREAFGTSQQRPVQRRLENLVLGDARKRGETHMWMWDRVNLAVALEEAGFAQARVVDYRTSAIPDWADIGLDMSPDEDSEYKPESLYMEAVR